jgi:hypothetical protein
MTVGETLSQRTQDNYPWLWIALASRCQRQPGPFSMTVGADPSLADAPGRKFAGCLVVAYDALLRTADRPSTFRTGPAI